MSTEFLAQVKNDLEGLVKAEFSESIILYGTDGPVTVEGIFDEIYQEVDPDTGAAINSTNPKITVWKSDIPVGFDQESQVDVRGNSYKAMDIMDDGEGSVMVKLYV